MDASQVRGNLTGTQLAEGKRRALWPPWESRSFPGNSDKSFVSGGFCRRNETGQVLCMPVKKERYDTSTKRPLARKAKTPSICPDDTPTVHIL